MFLSRPVARPRGSRLISPRCKRLLSSGAIDVLAEGGDIATTGTALIARSSRLLHPAASASTASHQQQHAVPLLGPSESGGLGLFATKAIPAGTSFFAERPVLTLRQGQCADRVLSEILKSQPTRGQELAAIFDALPVRSHGCTGISSVFTSASAWWVAPLPPIVSWLKDALRRIRQRARRRAIASSNQFVLQQAGLRKVFVARPFCNHSCSPNVYVCDAEGEDASPIAARWIALRDIARGEELGIFYPGLGAGDEERLLLAPMAARGERLKNDLVGEWGFACRCGICRRGGEELASSDARRRQLGLAWESLRRMSGRMREPLGRAAASRPDQCPRGVVEDIDPDEIWALLEQEQLVNVLPEFQTRLVLLALVKGGRWSTMSSRDIWLARGEALERIYLQGRHGARQSSSRRGSDWLQDWRRCGSGDEQVRVLWKKRLGSSSNSSLECSKQTVGVVEPFFYD